MEKFSQVITYKLVSITVDLLIGTILGKCFKNFQVSEFVYGSEIE